MGRKIKKLAQKRTFIRAWIREYFRAETKNGNNKNQGTLSKVHSHKGQL